MPAEQDQRGYSFYGKIPEQQRIHILSVDELKLHFPLSFRFAQGNRPEGNPTQKILYKAMHALHPEWKIALTQSEQEGVIEHTFHMVSNLVAHGVHNEYGFAEKPDYRRDESMDPYDQEAREEAYDMLAFMKETLNSADVPPLDEVIPELAVAMLQGDRFFLTRAGGRGLSKGDPYKSYVLQHALLGRGTGDGLYDTLFEHVGDYLRGLDTAHRSNQLSEADHGKYVLFLDVIALHNNHHHQQIEMVGRQRKAEA